MRALMVKDGKVVNKILLPDDFTGSEWAGHDLVFGVEANPGDLWDGSKATSDPTPRHPREQDQEHARIKELGAKPTLTAAEIQEAMKLALKRLK